MPVEAQNERELIIELKGDVVRLNENLERVLVIIERIETVKFENHEKRISYLERENSRLKGIGIAAGVLLTLLNLFIAYNKPESQINKSHDLHSIPRTSYLFNGYKPNSNISYCIGSYSH